MTLTRARTVQYIGILFSLLLVAVGYWYFSVRAGVKTNTGGLQPQGVGDLSAGLAGYWKLDETTGSSAADASTNGNAGTLTNMENGDWVAGQIGNGLDFDGVDEYVSIPDSSVYTQDALTVSVWVKNTTVLANRILVSKTNSGDRSWELMATGSGIKLYTASGLSDVGNSGEVSNVFTAGTWQHVVAVFNGNGSGNSGRMQIYINGVAQSITFTGTIPSTLVNNAEAVRLGIGSAFGSPFLGSLDEARIYNRPLSADEVGQLYRLTSPTGVDTSLKGYWSFNGSDISGTTAYDRSGAGNNGTLTNGPTISEGRVGQALNFWPGGSDTDARVNVGNISSLDVSTGDFTLTFWTKNTGYVNQGSGINTFAGKQGISACEAGYHIDYASANLPRLYIADSGCAHDAVVIHNANIADNQWHMITGTKSGTSINIAVDGVFTTAVSAASVGSLTNSKPFVIGDDGFTDGARNIQGLIDEVRFFNRVLSDAEVKSLYDRGAPDKSNTSALQLGGNGRLESGLAGYWKLDETTGSSAADASTNTNTGTLSNMENGDWVTGQIGNGLDFDGTNEYVGASATPFVSHSSGTITAWIKSTNGSAAQTIFGISTLASSNYGGYFHTNANGKLQMRIKGNGVDLVNCGVTDTGSSSQVAASGTWTFVAITNDGAGKKFYKNAFQQGTDCGSDTTWFDDLSAQPPADASIGAWLVAGGAQTLFLGSIDEIRVYDHALSPDEIGNLYRTTTPTAVDTGLKGYWSFNGQDMSGATAYDRSGAGKNATLTGSPTIEEGILGQGMYFDGINDYATTTATIPSQGSISLWAKPNIPLDPSSRGYFQNASEGGGHFQFGFNTYGGFDTWEFTYRGGYGSTVSMIGIPYTSDSAVQQWHHVVVSWDTATGSQMYVDGILVSSTTGTTGNFTAMPMSIGSDSSDFWKGNIDEVRLYNRILTDAEVKSFYDAGNPDKLNSSMSQPQGAGRLDSGLAGYWKLDETTGSSAADASTNGNAGTLTNMENGDWVTGRIGNGVVFDGVDEYVTVGTSSALDVGTNPFALSVWFKTTDTSGAIIGKGGTNSGGKRYYVGTETADCTSGQVKVDIDDDTTKQFVCSTTTVTDNAWHQVVLVRTRSTLEIYIDGKREGAPVDITGYGSLNSSRPFTIGSMYDEVGAAQGSFFSGTVDEPRLYNRALSSDEIAQIYRLGTPTGTETSLKGYWSFNGQDMSGTTAFDRSGSGNNGTLTNGPAITEGKLGQGLSFDGTDDYVATGTNANITGAITISAWAKTSSTAEGYFLANRNSSTGYGFFMRGSGNNYQLSFIYFGASQWNSANNVYAPDNLWHHYSVTNDLTDVRFYVDGTLVSTVAGASSGNSSPAALNLGTLIGNSIYFNGSLDEMRVYNRALSASEIKALYSSGK